MKFLTTTKRDHAISEIISGLGHEGERGDGPGPRLLDRAIFRQLRVGENGRLFRIYKVRTLSRTGEPPNGWVRALRNTGLDEVPQLFNVLRGEMALVGPRPLTPDEQANCRGDGVRRLNRRPGITGLAQILCGVDGATTLRVPLDLIYIAHRSVLLDLLICLFTIRRVIGLPVPIDATREALFRGRPKTPSKTVNILFRVLRRHASRAADCDCALCRGDRGAAPDQGIAVVTGASGGLGGAFCAELTALGWDVRATGRDADRLRDLQASGLCADWMAVDLASADAVTKLTRRWPEADMLVLAAGATTAGPLIDSTPSDTALLNVNAVLELSLAYGAGMVARHRGRVIFVASTVAGRPAPGMATYAASKAFQVSAARSLAAEWAPFGVSVTCCVPGPFRSEFAQRAGLADGNDGGGRGPAPRQIARRALARSTRPGATVFPDFGSWVRWTLYALIPNRLLSALARRKAAR